MDYATYINQFTIYKDTPLYRLRKKGFDVHHVVPKSLGGTDQDGLVVLTHEQHIEAHRLFAEEHPENKESAYSYIGVVNLNGVPNSNSCAMEGNTYSKNRKVHYFWATNGIENKMFPIKTTLPDGWLKGRCGLTAWNKGKIDIYSKETIEKIKQARLLQKNVNPYGARGKHWYTDGINSVLAFKCPEGFHEGRLKNRGN